MFSSYLFKQDHFLPFVTPKDDAILIHHLLRSLEKAPLVKKHVWVSNRDMNLDNGEFFQTGSFGRPSEAYTIIPDDLPSTDFCDLGQAVLNVVKNEVRFLIRWKGSLWCAFLYKEKTNLLTLEDCENENWKEET